MEGYDVAEPRVLDRLHELARTAPKIAPDDPRVAKYRRGEYRGHTQFGQNFVSHFAELRLKLDPELAERLGGNVHFTDPPAIYGIDLVVFYEDHLDLCAKIFEAIDGKATYDTLKRAYFELLEAEKSGDAAPGEAHRLNESAAHPMGIEGIGVYAWDRLNPLLEEAASYMSHINSRYTELFH